MELVLDEQQTLLRESARAFVRRHAGPVPYRGIIEAGTGFDRERLKAAAADGWIGLLVSPGRGGLGLGVTELALVMEAAGEGLMTEPVAELAVAAWAMSAGGAATGLGDVLSQLMAGERLVLPAIHDAQTAEEDDPRIVSTNEHHGYQLTGETPAIAFAAMGDDYLVDASTQDGTLIYAVRQEGGGILCHKETRMDGTEIGRLEFPGVFINEESLVAGREQGARMAAHIYDRILIGHVAEMLGLMQGAMALTLDYVRTREQFGRPIGSFQALQHRLVDDSLALETARSLLYQTCKAFDGRRGQRAMAAALKAQASEAVLQVTKSAIQLHGAIGFTYEHDAGLYLKRAMALSVQYGTAADHRRRFEKLSQESETDERPDGSRRRKRVRKKRRRSVFAGMSGG